MLLFSHAFRQKVRCYFNHVDTNDVALPQQAETRLNGARRTVSRLANQSASAYTVLFSESLHKVERVPRRGPFSPLHSSSWESPQMEGLMNLLFLQVNSLGYRHDVSHFPELRLLS